MKYDLNELIVIGTGKEKIFTDSVPNMFDFVQNMAKKHNAMRLKNIQREWESDLPKRSETDPKNIVVDAQSDPQTLFELGSDCYRDVRYGIKIFAFLKAKKAFQYFQCAAQAGHEEAKIWTGVCLLSGIGTKTDSKQAIEYLMQSEEGRKKLGIAYILGEGVVRDLNKAWEIFENIKNTPNPLDEFDAIKDGELWNVELLMRGKQKNKKGSRATKKEM